MHSASVSVRIRQPTVILSETVLGVQPEHRSISRGAEPVESFNAKKFLGKERIADLWYGACDARVANRAGP
jgi:hypothetical protein